MKQLNINAGELAIGQDGELISTVLGSCIAVCVYDKRLKIGGMNHYLLPESKNSEESLEPLRFGSLAIIELFKRLKRLGCRKEDLRVKIIGGATGIPGVKSISNEAGTGNVAIARKIIAELGFAIAAEQVGGNTGRKIEFNTATGELRFKPMSVESDVHIAETSSSKIGGQSDNKQSDNKQGDNKQGDNKQGDNKQGDNKNDKKIDEPEKLKRPVKVLIVDDAAPVRMVLRKIMDGDSRIVVIGEAKDPAEADKIREKVRPDVITLDLHMPGKDGVTYLSEYMRTDPVPTIIVTDYNLKETGPVMQALESGAFDYVQKPAFNQINEVKEILISKIMAASKVKTKNLQNLQGFSSSSKVKTESQGTIIGLDQSVIDHSLIVIGASTGGTEALKRVLTALPKDVPPIVIVQHMPPVFTKSFADRLNEMCRFSVKEAADGDMISSRNAYIAPGGMQLKLKQRKTGVHVQLTDDPPENRFKPSVDYMFRSAKDISLERVAVILTGMGDDGASEMLELKKNGVFTIAQDEASCVVFGMPKVAIELGGTCLVKPLDQIAQSMMLAVNKKKRAA